MDSAEFDCLALLLALINSCIVHLTGHVGHDIKCPIVVGTTQQYQYRPTTVNSAKNHLRYLETHHNHSGAPTFGYHIISQRLRGSFKFHTNWIIIQKRWPPCVYSVQAVSNSLPELGNC